MKRAANRSEFLKELLEVARPHQRDRRGFLRLALLAGLTLLLGVPAEAAGVGLSSPSTLTVMGVASTSQDGGSKGGDDTVKGGDGGSPQLGGGGDGDRPN